MAATGEFEVKREVTIPASRAAVYALLVDFHRWREWSPWEDIDPAMSRTYSGPDAGVGAVYEWVGDRKTGAGRMEITDAVESSKVQIALQFLKPFKSSSTTTFELVERDGATEVTWRMVGPKTFMTRFMGVFMSMDKMVGKDFDKGLTQLAAAATT
ncbi:MAG TPA: SRPBCC family protein [Acidimicrobiia bacterium]|jgi:uncharacterized protein YndB with AHSA1/START domain